jgi:hypothetical protein
MQDTLCGAPVNPVLWLLTVLTPQAVRLAAYISLACFKTDLIAFRLLDGTDQIRLPHFARLDVMLFCYFLDFIKFHISISLYPMIICQPD